MGRVDDRSKLLLVPSLAVLTAVRLAIKLVPDSAGSVVSFVAFVFSLVKIPVDAPTTEWVLGWVLMFLVVLLFSDAIFLPQYEPRRLWQVSISVASVLTGIVFEQAVGGSWVGFTEPQYALHLSSSTNALIVFGPSVLFLAVAAVSQNPIRSGDHRREYGTVGITLRAWILTLLIAFLVALLVLVSSLVDILFVSVTVVGTARILFSTETLDEIEEVILQAVCGIWGEPQDVILSIYSSAIVFGVTITIGAVRSVIPELDVVREYPINVGFLLVVAASTLLYVFYYTVRLNRRIYERIYNKAEYMEETRTRGKDQAPKRPPKRVAGLLLPVPLSYYVLDRSFPAADFSTAVSATELTVPIAVENLVFGACVVGLNVFLMLETLWTDGTRWRIVSENKPFDGDVHVIPLALSNITLVTGGLLVGIEDPLSRPLLLGLGVLMWNAVTLSPYYGFFLLGRLREGKIEDERHRKIAGVWGIFGVAIMIYVLVLFFTPFDQIVTSTLGFVLGFYLVLVALPTVISSDMSGLTFVGSIALFVLASVGYLATTPLADVVLATAYAGLTDPVSNPVDFVVVCLAGIVVVFIYRFVESFD